MQEGDPEIREAFGDVFDGEIRHQALVVSLSLSRRLANRVAVEAPLGLIFQT